MNDSFTQRILTMPPKRDLNRSLLLVAADSIHPNPRQPRREFSREDLSNLMVSIAQVGLIQPLTVRPCEGGQYELVAGERRYRACVMLGMREIPCVVRSISSEQSAVMALVENVQRRDLHYLEEARCLLSLLNEYGFTQEQLALRIGKSQAYLSNKLRVLRLPEALLSEAMAGGLSERHLRALLALPSDSQKLDCARKAIALRWSVVRTEEHVKACLAGKTEQAKIRYLFKDDRIFVNGLKAQAAQLRATGAQVEISEKRTTGGTDIVIRIRHNSVQSVK